MPRCIIGTHSTMNFLILQSGIISPMLLQAACNSCFLASRKPVRKCYMFYSTRNGGQDARKSDIYAKKNQQCIFKYFYGVKNAEAVYAVPNVSFKVRISHLQFRQIFIFINGCKYENNIGRNCIFSKLKLFSSS